MARRLYDYIVVGKGLMGAAMLRAGQWAYDLEAAPFRGQFVGEGSQGYCISTRRKRE